MAKDVPTKQVQFMGGSLNGEWRKVETPLPSDYPIRTCEPVVNINMDYTEPLDYEAPSSSVIIEHYQLHYDEHHCPTYRIRKTKVGER